MSKDKSGVPEKFMGKRRKKIVDKKILSRSLIALQGRLFHFLALFAKDFHKYPLFGKISKNGP
jgi:hypothetical protein